MPTETFILRIVAGACAVTGVLILVMTIRYVRTSQSASERRDRRWLHCGLAVTFAIMGFAIALSLVTVGALHDLAGVTLALVNLIWPVEFFMLTRAQRSRQS